MAPATLIKQLRAAGCQLRADGEQLRVQDPGRALTDDLRQAIREHKAELIESIRAEAPKWIVERNLNPTSVAEAFRRYVAETHGGQMPDWPHGTLLARLNAWLQPQGEKPTTLPVLRDALGMHAAWAENPSATIARCPMCGGTNWGPSGRRKVDGAEVWHCITCADQHTPIDEGAV